LKASGELELLLKLGGSTFKAAERSAAGIGNLYENCTEMSTKSAKFLAVTLGCLLALTGALSSLIPSTAFSSSMGKDISGLALELLNVTPLEECWRCIALLVVVVPEARLARQTTGR
jgi:hypothetical protein